MRARNNPSAGTDKIAFVGLIILSCMLIFHKGTCQGSSFTFSGEIAGQRNGSVSLIYDDNTGARVEDSCGLRQGRFVFEGRIKEPTMAILKENGQAGAAGEGNSTQFWLTPGKSNAFVPKDHFSGLRIPGSKVQQEYEDLNRQIAPVLKASSSIESDFLKTDRLYLIAGKEHEQRKMDSLAARLDVIRSRLEPSGRELSEITQKFIARHPASYVSAFELYAYKSRWPPDSVRRLYGHLSPAIRQSSYGRKVKEMIDGIEGHTAGKTAKDFTARGMHGGTVRLSDFKGSYVLLDFWASWCGPCRKDNPHLVRLFKEYHDEGLDIISVSDDEDAAAWTRAIRKDGLDAWDNVLSGAQQTGGKPRGAASLDKMYGVQVLPTRILIDRDGKIIGRYTGEPEPALDKKLTQLFGRPQDPAAGLRN